MKKVALVVTDSFSAWHFRRGLIKALIRKGIAVYIITPTGPYTRNLKDLGAKHIHINISRFMDLLGDIKFFLNLYRIFRRERFDVVHNFSIKPNTYGAVAARLAGVKKILGAVTGLGYLFTNEQKIGISVLKFFAVNLYRLGFRCSDKIWFQNNDDIEAFVTAGIAIRDKAVLIKSSGVDTDEFSTKAVDECALLLLRNEFGPSASKIVTMVARPLWNKGIKEFVEASFLLRKRMSDAIFIVVGEKEPGNPDNVPDAYIKEKESEKLRFIGWRNDVREIFALSIMVVLPSYREGTPKSSIEAMAMGKPLVTTDAVGCKETVDDHKNGIIVPVGDSRKLADAIYEIASDEKLIKSYGLYSRKKAETEFDEKIVVGRIISELYQL